MGDDPNTHCLKAQPGSSYPGSTGNDGLTQRLTFSIPYNLHGPHDAGGAGSFPAIPPVDTKANFPALSSDVNQLFAEQEALSGGSISASPTTPASEDQMHFIFTDVFGENFTSQAVDSIFSPTSGDIKTSFERAFATLPNKVARSVSVEVTSAPDRASVYTCTTCGPLSTEVTITYNADQEDANLVGPQNLLSCPSAYGCRQPGCRPLVKMPFGVRYVGHDTALSLATVFSNNNGKASSDATTSNLDVVNYNADPYNAYKAHKIVMLAADSDPRLPLHAKLNNQVDGLQRFDMRVEVLVVDRVDGATPTADAAQDLYFYRVGYYTDQGDEADGSFTSSSYEDDDKRWLPSETTPANKKMFPTPTSATSYVFEGFTAGGRIPLKSHNRVRIPELPGTYLNFESPNMVGDGEIRAFEIAIKLPTCSVEVEEGAAGELALGSYVELLECSGRGSCDYTSGECKCFEGYYGRACSVRTTLV